MKIHTFTQEQWLPRSREEVFPFFADARNLEAITPPWVGFQILTPGPIEMTVGAIIDYRIRLHGIPLRWRTEITAWSPLDHFVDEQRRGPYRRWVHTHRFVPRDGGTLCLDHVEYAVPGGGLVNRWLVRPDIERIFAFRRGVLDQRFGPLPA
jgi:ligand-binding SRPBCC domain-containing protein